jgi:hypothetical protein
METKRALVLGGLVALASCGSSGVTQAMLGEPVVLRVGESAGLTGEGVRFGVSGVPEDSRCPDNVVCVWAGVATVSAWLQKAPQPREELVLTTTPFAGHLSRADALGYEVELVAVAPGKSETLQQSDYRITLVVRAK